MHISAQKKYIVILTVEDKKAAERLIRKGVHSARVIRRARTLLLADAGKKDREICSSLGIDRSVVSDTRKHYVAGGMQRALYELPRPGQKRKLTGEQEAQVIAIACSKAPKGYVRWTMDLLTEEVNNKLPVSIGRTAIWKVLLRNNLKPWLKKNVVYSKGYTRIYRTNA